MLTRRIVSLGWLQNFRLFSVAEVSGKRDLQRRGFKFHTLLNGAHKDYETISLAADTRWGFLVSFLKIKLYSITLVYSGGIIVLCCLT